MNYLTSIITNGAINCLFQIYYNNKSLSIKEHVILATAKTSLSILPNILSPTNFITHKIKSIDIFRGTFTDPDIRETFKQTIVLSTMIGCCILSSHISQHPCETLLESILYFAASSEINKIQSICFSNLSLHAGLLTMISLPFYALKLRECMRDTNSFNPICYVIQSLFWKCIANLYVHINIQLSEFENTNRISSSKEQTEIPAEKKATPLNIKELDKETLRNENLQTDEYQEQKNSEEITEEQNKINLIKNSAEIIFNFISSRIFYKTQSVLFTSTLSKITTIPKETICKITPSFYTDVILFNVSHLISSAITKTLFPSKSS